MRIVFIAICIVIILSGAVLLLWLDLSSFVIITNVDGSADEKNRVEEKQRLASKDRKKKKEEWEPRLLHN